MLTKYIHDNYIAPEKGLTGWYVYCVRGLLEVISKGEWKSRDEYAVLLANNAMIRVVPGDQLAKALEKIGKTHDIMLFPTHFSANGYIKWDGHIFEFDAIKFVRK